MEELVKFSMPHKAKPVSETVKEKRRAYYEAHKDTIKERARIHSKTAYENPEFKENVRKKNANYRLILKQAKELLLQKATEFNMASK
jgi:hypothetical protein